jgi:hypothetical protein
MSVTLQSVTIYVKIVVEGICRMPGQYVIVWVFAKDVVFRIENKETVVQGRAPYISIVLGIELKHRIAGQAVLQSKSFKCIAIVPAKKMATGAAEDRNTGCVEGIA